MSSPWIRRLFIVAIAPSVAMIFALLFFPQSELATCPLMNRSAIIFLPLNSTDVLPQSSIPTDGSRIVFLGQVLDVSSGAKFYARGMPYHALACGKDVTRALLKSSLDAADLNEYIEDISKGEIREKLTEWLPFFRNKYPQIGVVAGNFFDSHGNPTPLFLEYTSLISPKPAPPVVMEDCVFHGNDQVNCESKFLSPKIKKSRGKGTCVCVNENEIFSIKTTDFVVSHFTNCEGINSCTVNSFEL